MRMPVTKKLVFCFAVAVAMAGFNHAFDVRAGSACAQHAHGVSAVALRASGAASSARPESDDPWSADELIQPAALAKALTGEQKPVVLQIGVVHLYRISHVPGAKFVGVVSTPEGTEALKQATRDLSRDAEVVAYCGCCPWGDCPNIRPAYTALREMGFKRIRLLFLPNNFAQDWATKGYPVEKGGA